MNKDELSQARKNLKKLLRMPKSKKSEEVLDRIIGNTQGDINKIIPKLEKLRKRIKTIKGSITYSQSGNYVKLVQTSQVNAREALFFYQLVRKWQEDNKIELYYYPLKNSFYIK